MSFVFFSLHVHERRHASHLIPRIESEPDNNSTCLLLPVVLARRV